MKIFPLALLMVLAGATTALAADRPSSSRDRGRHDDRHDRDRDRDRGGWDRDRDRHDHDRDWDRDRDDRERRDWDRRDRERWERHDRGRGHGRGHDHHDHDRSDRNFHRALDLARFVVEVIDGRHYRHYDCGCRHEWRHGRYRMERSRRVWVPGCYVEVHSCRHHHH